MKIKETALLAEALGNVTALLPRSWRIERRADTGAATATATVDAIIDLVSPSGKRTSFAVDVRVARLPPSGSLLSTLRHPSRDTSLPVLLVSNYLGPAVRTALTNAGVNYADATGWVLLTSEDPLILLTGRGAAKSPKSAGSSAVMRMNGVAASRIIRTLATQSTPMGVRQLAASAMVSPGSVSKLLATLGAEGVVDRGGHGEVLAVHRRALIHRWADDYSFKTCNQPIRYCIAPRGMDRTLSRLGDSTLPVALTGAAAARMLLPAGTTSVVPMRLLAVYCADPAALADELSLIVAEPATANMLVALPQDPAILAPSGASITLAPTPLVLADLLTLPNRSDAEVDQLMDVLARTIPAWRD